MYTQPPPAGCAPQYAYPPAPGLMGYAPAGYPPQPGQMAYAPPPVVVVTKPAPDTTAQASDKAGCLGMLAAVACCFLTGDASLCP
ncbi:unnamed protein product [Victoria cruziana]